MSKGKSIYSKLALLKNIKPVVCPILQHGDKGGEGNEQFISSCRTDGSWPKSSQHSLDKDECYL